MRMTSITRYVILQPGIHHHQSRARPGTFSHASSKPVERIHIAASPSPTVESMAVEQSAMIKNHASHAVKQWCY